MKQSGQWRASSMHETAKRRCPNCAAEYLIVRVEASPRYDELLLCTSCGGPLQSREGRFVIKYFRRSGLGPNYRNGRQRKLR